MSNVVLAEGDEYLERMKKAKRGPAVLKTRLVNLKSGNPNSLIFAFEGDDDKTVYYQWINKICPELNQNYEPFPCGGKDQVLGLKDVIDRDLNGIGENIYFFVDRDFDDLKSHEPSPNIFMTCQYSIENYLVTTEVVEEILKNEFQCHGQKECRRSVSQLFSSLLEQFLNLTKEVNFSLYLARRLQIELKNDLPTRISGLAKVTLDEVKAIDKQAEEIVVLERRATEEEVARLRPEFESLDPATRYRGKFSLLFFSNWLVALERDRNIEQPKYFPPLQKNEPKAKVNLLTLANLSSKSHPPPGLHEFVQRIPLPGIT